MNELQQTDDIFVLLSSPDHADKFKEYLWSIFL